MEWSVNGWIEHDGKGMPVGPDDEISVRLRDESVIKGPFPASDYGAQNGKTEGMLSSWWEHRDEWFDIVAYKVKGK